MKREGRGAKIQLVPRANDVLLARAGNVEINLPYLMHSLGMNDDASPVDVSAEKLSERQSDREKCC